jgi:hypothetical protein
MDEDDSASSPRWQAAISNDDCRPMIPSRRKRCLPKPLREAQDGFEQSKVILQELDHSSSIDATTETAASKMVENHYAGGHQQNEQSRTKSSTDGPLPTIRREASPDSCLEKNGRCPAA